MLELCGLKGHRIGGASSRPSTRTSSRTRAERRVRDCIALMAEARRRAREQFGVELEREVVLRRRARAAGDDVGTAGARRTRPMAGGRTERGSRRPTRAASVVVPFPRGVSDARLDLARFVPSGRSLLVAFVLVSSARRGYWGAYASSVFAVERVDVRGAPPAGRARVGTRDRRRRARVSSRSTRTASKESCARFRRSPECPSTVRFRTRSSYGSRRSGPSPWSARGTTAWLVTGSRQDRPRDRARDRARSFRACG